MLESRQPLDDKLVCLRVRLRALGAVLVCYSGGVDSAFVLPWPTKSWAGERLG